MVVARPRVAQELAAGRLAERPNRRLRRDERQRLDRGRNGGIREPVVTMPAALLAAQEAAGDEPSEMLAGRRRGDPGAVRQVGHREGAVCDHGRDERSPCGLRQERGRGGDVSVALHGLSVSPGRFVQDRSVKS